MKQDILRVQMFGKFELTYGDQKISCTGSRSKLLWNLLAYLLCHKGELISSEELIPIIWKYDKNDNPAGAMRTAIHRARSMIGELTNDSSVQFLISKNGGYMWNPEIETDFDVENFDKLVSKTAEKDNAEACLEAIEIYEGKFLPMQSSELWVMPVQAYYHNIYESLIDQVVPFLEKENRFEEGIVICNSALKIDPYSEKIYQYLMRFLLIAEDRQEVVRVYEEMSKLLLTTFGIMPDQESRALYREALSSVKNGTVISPEIVQEQLCEQGDIKGALVCDYDFFKMLYQSQARAIVRSGIVVHTALLTVKSRNKQEVSSKSVSLAMDHLEEHLQKSSERYNY